MSMKLVIVGGVAGGATAAARARRMSEDAQITLFERGEYISFANCGLPYHIGGEIEKRDSLLVRTPEEIEKRYNIAIRTRSEVVGIDADAKEVEVVDHATGGTYRESYDKLILSPGAAPIRPPIPGADLPNVLVLRNIPDTDAIKAKVDEGEVKRAIVVGGGFIGLEMAENLRRREIEVGIVEMLDQVMPPLDYDTAVMLHRHLELNGVELHLNDGVSAFAEDGDGGLEVTLSSGKKLVCDLVVLGVGVRPESALAKAAGLELGARDAIKVNERLQTSNPDIYAVGDAIEVNDFVTGSPAIIPLAGPANRQARIAVDNIFGRSSEYRGTLGTAIVRVFDLAAASTGANEKTLKKQGIEYRKSFVYPSSHASYFPGATQMCIKLLFAPSDGKVLGAQIVGGDGVDKRIDVIATAIQGGMTVHDLSQLELAYAPPYNSVRDPVNVAGYVAVNILNGDVDVTQWEDMQDLTPDGNMTLDVRTPTEFASGHIPNAVNIPVDDLRKRLDELPKDKCIVTYCKVGLRGYLAARILKQKGFSVKNLSGGYSIYNAVLGKDVSTPAQKASDASEASSNSDSEEKTEDADVELDACGMQCPGPIVRISSKIEAMQEGQLLRVMATDPGFVSDLPAWCNATSNELVSIGKEKDKYVAVIRKGTPQEKAADEKTNGRGADKTIVVFSNDLDKAMAAFIIANGAAAMGRKVTLFFTFWGLNILRRDKGVKVDKSFMEKMFGMMMPKGVRRLSLSKMNMAGLGTLMMKKIMRQKNVLSLEELVEQAKAQGVKLVACAMSMDVMGIKKEELIDGVEVGGVAAFLDSAERSNMSLFI